MIRKKCNLTHKIKKPPIFHAPEPSNTDFDRKLLQKSRSGWISPNGCFHPCKHATHEEEAVSHCESIGGYFRRSYADSEASYLESKGWIRVSCCIPGIPEKAYRNDSMEWFLPAKQYDCLYALVDTHYPGKAGKELSSFFFRPIHSK